MIQFCFFLNLVYYNAKNINSFVKIEIEIKNTIFT